MDWMGKKEQKLPTPIREPSAEYMRAKDIPAFFGQPMLKGTYTKIDSDRKWIQYDLENAERRKSIR
jgi:hypothetical protein